MANKKWAFFTLLVLNSVFIGVQGAMDLVARGAPDAIVVAALTGYAVLVGVAVGVFL